MFGSQSLVFLKALTHQGLLYMHVPSTMILQVAGEPLLPANNEGLQNLLLSALLMPHVLGLSASDASAGKRMALAAKARISCSYSSLIMPAQC